MDIVNGKRIIETPDDLTTLKKECIERVRYYVDWSSKKLGIHFPMPQIRFSIQGTTAGKAIWPTNVILFNPTLIALNPDEFIERTPGHEVAHLASFFKFARQRKISPHGDEWQQIMWAFRLPATRCHNYETSPMAALRKKPEPTRTDNGLIVRPTATGRIVELD